MAPVIKIRSWRDATLIGVTPVEAPAPIVRPTWPNRSLTIFERAAWHLVEKRSVASPVDGRSLRAVGFVVRADGPTDHRRLWWMLVFKAWAGGYSPRVKEAASRIAARYQEARHA